MGPEIALSIGALGFGFMGFGALVRPEQVTRQFGIAALDIDGRNEVRAVYGGFGLVMAVILAFVAVEDEYRTGVALTVALALVGMALGRAISAGIDASITRVPLLYLIIELIGAAILLYAAFG